MSDFLTTERLGPQQSLTPEGFLVIRAVPLARTGPQLYSDQEIPIKGDATGRIIIDRNPEDVFAPQTIASLQGKAVTLDHPDDDVTPENYRDVAVGHVINPRRGQNAMNNLLFGDLVITDPDAIKAIRDREVREVSVGYKADYRQTGDARGRQTNILCNHLALVRDGRCGPSCRIGDRAFFAKDTSMPPMNNLGAGGARLETTPPLDKDLADLVENAPTNFAMQLWEEQARRNKSRMPAEFGRFEVGDQKALAGTGQSYRRPYVGDQEEPEEQQPDEEMPDSRVMGTFDPPPPGFVYQLEDQGDVIALVLATDNGEDLNTNDRTYKHRVSDGIDPILSRMNGIHRRLASRDWAAKRKFTIQRHHILPTESLTVEQRGDGFVDVVLWAATDPRVYANSAGWSSNEQEDNPGSGHDEVWVAQSSQSGGPPGEHAIRELSARTTGDRRMPEPQMLSAMNAAARHFWAAR